MRREVAAIVLLVGCGGDLDVSPGALHWGEVDFHAERPPEGHQAARLTLTNDGARPLDLIVTNLDTVHLTVTGVFVHDDPPTLPTLAPGEQAVLTVGAWDYVPGEREGLVEGAFTLSADGLRHPVDVPWSFVPVRNIPTDTGP